MPRYIIKIREKYFIWSTIVDAPITVGMTKTQLEDYIKDEYGWQGLNELPERLKRVEEKGTSALEIYNSMEETVKCNRAGNKEACLTIDEIYEKYAGQYENLKQSNI